MYIAINLNSKPIRVTITLGVGWGGGGGERPHNVLQMCQATFKVNEDNKLPNVIYMYSQHPFLWELSQYFQNMMILCILHMEVELNI